MTSILASELETKLFEGIDPSPAVLLACGCASNLPKSEACLDCCHMREWLIRIGVIKEPLYKCDEMRIWRNTEDGSLSCASLRYFTEELGMSAKNLNSIANGSGSQWKNWIMLDRYFEDDGSLTLAAAAFNAVARAQSPERAACGSEAARTA